MEVADSVMQCLVAVLTVPLLVDRYPACVFKQKFIHLDSESPPFYFKCSAFSWILINVYLNVITPPTMMMPRHLTGFVFRRYLVLIPDMVTTILSEAFRGFPHCLQEHISVWLRSLSSKSFSIYDASYHEHYIIYMLKASLNKQKLITISPSVLGFPIVCLPPRF
jgi:hypothetical protein